MLAHALSPTFLSDAWKVLLLFIIPIGSGIPGGVVLAQSRGFAWPLMVFLYFISDVMLAVVFEPLLLLFVKYSKRSPRLNHFREAFSKAMTQTVARYGINPGPFSLIMITFGTDPMTGRSVAFAAGHGFLTGWALTIIGDLLYFTVIMVSTLWLNSVLGNGTTAAIIIMVAMVAMPPGIRWIRGRLKI
ncbi:MAG: hypothetical protein ACXWQO_09420 [Bdellovibrionota bacterium]